MLTIQPDWLSFKNLPLAASRRFFLAKQKLSPVLIWAALAGTITGLIGGLFRLFVHQIFSYRLDIVNSLSNLPFLGVIVSICLSASMAYGGFFLMRKFAPETGGSGIPQIEGYLDGWFPLNWRRVLPVKFGAGLLVLGSGMVLGREGPTIQMGGSIGKMVGSGFRVSQEQMKILVAASAGAGLATAFNAPLSGILFIYEEVRPNFANPATAYRAVSLAVVMAVIILQLLIGNEPALLIKVFDPPPLASLWIFAVLGIGLGIIGYLFNRGLLASLNFFARQRGVFFSLIGLWVGGLIGLMAWIYPATTGGGENMIIWSLDTHEPGIILLLLCGVRLFMTWLCYGAGAPGGIFAPLLSIATVFSQGVARLAEISFPQLLPEPAILTVAGMGGLVAATVRAPLTAIVLTLEVTANYQLILPILVTCLIATMTAHGLGGQPIYTVLLDRMLMAQESAQQNEISDNPEG